MRRLIGANRRPLLADGVRLQNDVGAFPVVMRRVLRRAGWWAQRYGRRLQQLLWVSAVEARFQGGVEVNAARLLASGVASLGACLWS
jgi:hypothetical protein